jgi:hypothetical protein
MLLNRTQVENFQNSKLCLLRAFRQTPGRRPGHLQPLLINRRLRPSPARPRSPSPCPASPQRPPPSPALARAKPRRRRTKKVTMVTSCAPAVPLLPSSPCCATTLPTSPQHRRTCPCPSRTTVATGTRSETLTRAMPDASAPLLLWPIKGAPDPSSELAPLH